MKFSNLYFHKNKCNNVVFDKSLDYLGLSVEQFKLSLDVIHQMKKPRQLRDSQLHGFITLGQWVSLCSKVAYLENEIKRDFNNNEQKFIDFYNEKKEKHIKGREKYENILEIKRKGVDPFDYQEYLKSDEWKEMSVKIKEQCRTCVLCNEINHLICHHRTYKNRYTRQEEYDLTALCRECHETFHKTHIYNSEKGIFLKTL